MKVHVAYVVYDGALGCHILGVNTNQDKAKTLCLVHHEQEEGTDAFDWVEYNGGDGQGVQSIHHNGKCYYVEQTELEVLTRVGDSDPETGLSWEARQILSLTIANGQLATQSQQIYNMIRPLQERERVLERYINYLFSWLKMASVDFPNNSFEFKLGHGLPNELWDIQDWEKDVDTNLDTPGGK